MNKKGLKSKSIGAIISLLVIILGAIFLSSNFTGYTVADVNMAASNYFGGFLFLIGIIIAFYFFKQEDNKPTKSIR